MDRLVVGPMIFGTWFPVFRESVRVAATMETKTLASTDTAVLHHIAFRRRHNQKNSRQHRLSNNTGSTCLCPLWSKRSPN